jgi:hypothetical protein
MSTGSSTKPNRTPIFIIGGVVGCLFLCACIAVGATGAYFIFGRSTPVAVASPVPTSHTNQVPTGLNPTPQPTESAIDFATYTGSGAPFTIKYPSDWDVEDQEASQNSVVFISPSQTASANVTYGKLGTTNLSDAFDQILTKVFQDPNIIAKTKNSDQSLSAELEHTSAAFGGRVHGYVRLVPAGNTYYIVQFNVLVDEFGQYKDVGKTIVNSLTVSP